MDFDNGDEVLQIGHVSMLSGLRHTYRRSLHQMRGKGSLRAAA